MELAASPILLHYLSNFTDLRAFSVRASYYTIVWGASPLKIYEKVKDP